VLRGIMEPKSEEVTGGWKKLHKQDLCNLNSSLNIVMVVKSRRMNCTGHVARMTDTILVRN
jgi:hypothetical protein